MDQEIRAAVQRYVDGCAAADPALVREAFAPNARMWGYLGPDYVEMSGEDFVVNVVEPAEPAGPDYASQISGIDVTGDTAHAVLEEQGFLGANFRNHFGLVRRNGVWRIVSKVFTTV
ncbi:nuclear transport factor 2 family protein [Leucobacter sp. CSA2]|uniref:Nuclear transport factor 2 family protein n=1 Tax=Leucobacter edaphi TaxID=2796472 RepID=A0A934QEI6_9MICO|nr:nuclear transport factor 2 family protein [Leucobacter edaphi]MBK0422506.1 nuclear transport factor 2 family protein [Leucobacter edaphi]